MPEMPANLDAEKAVLGAVLLDNERYLEVSELSADDFYLDAHRRIFARMKAIAERGQPVEQVTLIEELDANKDLKPVGDVAYVSSLIEGLPDRPSIASYVGIVRDKSMLRKVIHACNIAIARAKENKDDPLSVVRDLDARITHIGVKVPTKAHSLKELIPAVLNEMASERERATEWIGIPTGISELDSQLGGIRQSELWIVGGLPSSGKTSLGIEHAISACVVDNATGKQIPTCMFSMEMKEKRIVRRLLAAKTVAGRMDPEMRDQLAAIGGIR